MTLPEKRMEQEAQQVIAMLEKVGYEAYFVGGFVRDRLLGLRNDDIDITTSARPDEVMALFPKVIPTGLQHGTVTVRMGEFQFEVTTFRTEQTYVQHRRPSEVVFVRRLKDDLARRDFTMNAMAMTRNFELIDPFGGRNDLRKGVLRAVGDAGERFEEDALRMMRALRFASSLRLQIEEGTWEALRLKRPFIAHIAVERISAELDRIIAGPHVGYGLQLLHDSGLLDGYPRLSLARYYDRIREDGALRHSMAAFVFADETFISLTVECRWLLMGLCMRLSADESAKLARELRWSKLRIQQWMQALEWMAFLRSWRAEQEGNLGEAAQPLRMIWQQGAVRHGIAPLERCIELCRQHTEWMGAVLAGENISRQISEFGAQWLTDMPLKQAAELAVSGRDLLHCYPSKQPGPWLADVLQRLLLEAATGQVGNERHLLLERAACYEALQSATKRKAERDCE